MTDELVIVPHTHWDREWYLPFQQFRLQLIGLLDQVLQRMEDDPRQRFTLDGQTVAVEDYLEIRPEQRERLAALVKAGRLAVGPWRILMDEFLCSGENIVRNLRLGLAKAEALGATMRVGYLPDMFGHCAQMPQILAGAGIEHACVWRGVPKAVDAHAFAWTSPDGTAVRTEYMAAGGYGNAAGLFDEPGQVEERAAAAAAKLRPWRPDGRPMLAMYGSDHTAPAADLADLLEEFNAGFGAEDGGVRMRLATLTEYFADQPADVAGLRVVDGELRSHARANILPGVFSVRAPLKQAMSRAERTVERYAEPLSALWHTPSVQRFLDMAWDRLIEVSCHDSVTGCGADETAQQVASRIAEAEQLGLAVRDLVGKDLAAVVPHDGHVLMNPTPAARTALVRLDVAGAGEVSLVDGDGRVFPAQTMGTAPELLADDVFAADRLGTVLASVHGIELYGQEITGWSITEDGADRPVLDFTVARRSELRFDVAEVKAALADAVVRRPGDWRVRITAQPRRTVMALVETPALGHSAVRAVPAQDAAVANAVTVEGRTLDNGLLRVVVAEDGTFSLRTRGGVETHGVGRIVDGGDLGDTYNYAPPAADVIVDSPYSMQVTTVHDGPLAAVLDVVRRYGWPAAGDFTADGRSTDVEPTVVTSRVELRAGEPFARLRVSFDNRSDDHRVRLHLPLPEQASSSFAEGQFAVVERGLTAEEGFGEEALPTFPASSFVAAGGLGVLLEHATEFELVDEGREMALTLLRPTGSISRNRHVHRLEPAGPQIATPEAQCRGLRTVEFGLLPYSGAWHDGGVLEAAEAFRHEVATLPGTAPSATELPASATGLELSGTGVVLASLRRTDGGEWLEARLIAEHPRATGAVLRLDGLVEACRADLLGTPVEPVAVVDGTVSLPLRAWEIATVRLRRRT